MGKMIRRLIGEDITIKTRLTENLPRILADTSQIEQILINLVVNARDALLAVKDNGRQKTITIETRSAPAETDLPANFLPFTDQQPSHRQYIEFSVADNGIGMDETTQQRIFEPFFTTKEKFKGTGLGLAIIYGIVKQNNGVIQIHSTLDQGTTFYIYWPVAKEQEKELAHKSPPQKNRQGNETILLIEDEEAVREFSKKTLASRGYTVYTAENGQVAIERLLQGLQVDLIITDIIMPVMNGWEFTIEAKRIYPEQKIIYLSGYAEDYLFEARPPEDETTDRNKMAGNVIAGNEIVLISKPFSIGELVTTVRKVLDEISS
jgi:CheY-like chemotaxis protein